MVILIPNIFPISQTDNIAKNGDNNTTENFKKVHNIDFL